MTLLSRWIDLHYAVLALVFSGVSALLGVLARQYSTFPGDRQVAAAARGLGERFEPIAYTFNELNGFIAVGLVAMVGGGLLWRRRLEAVAVVAAVVALRPLLNRAKELVDRPRPSGDFPALDIVGDSSFPSGHTMTAVTVFGLLFFFAAELLPHRLVLPARAAAVTGIGLAATSRMWAGVHWFSDTWGAVFWTLALMMAVLAVRPAISRLAVLARQSASIRRAPLDPMSTTRRGIG